MSETSGSPSNRTRAVCASALIVTVAVVAAFHQIQLGRRLTGAQGQTGYLTARTHIRAKLAEHAPAGALIGFAPPRQGSTGPLAEPFTYDRYRYLLGPYRLVLGVDAEASLIIADADTAEALKAGGEAPGRRVVATLEPGVYLLQ